MSYQVGDQIAGSNPCYQQILCAEHVCAGTPWEDTLVVVSEECELCKFLAVASVIARPD